MNRFFFFFFLLFFVTNSFAQDCNCYDNFVWLKQTFEINDAGFQYVIDKKGVQEYQQLTQKTEEKTKNISTIYDCAEILRNWLSFFRSNHIGLGIIKEYTTENQSKTTTFYDKEFFNIDTTGFKQYLDTKKNFNFEGIWFDENYTIGVKMIGNQYIGFVINSKYEEWTSGQVKFKIYKDSIIYYMRDYSKKVFNRANLLSKNFLLFDYNIDFSFTRYYPKYEDKFLNSYIDRKPYFETLNNKTCYLRIPSFNYELLQVIDSIIFDNKKKIIKTENLIIDLRLNSGGSDNCWQHIIPIFFTNPYRQKNLYYLSTELNNQHYLKYSGNNLFDILNKKLGQFIKNGNDYYEIKSWEKVYKFPKQIAIVVDRYCASSTEQFLLAAKQSKKVKVFGNITAGALDFANINSVNSPCDDFVLIYATSKDVDLENFPLDNIGIQPDFYIDKDIPEYKWIDYVNDILNYSNKK